MRALRRSHASPSGTLSVWRAGIIPILVLAVVGCTTPERPAEPQDSSSQAPKRMNIGILGDPPLLYNSLVGAESADDVAEELVNRGLTEADDRRTFRPVLAEDVPSVENGLWKVLPDGRMETTWRIKPGVVWHDGAPYTSADLLFTLRAVMDRELPLTRRNAYASIEGGDVPDERTITVRWARPYIYADTMFSRELALPIPKHILEKPATDDKANFEHHPYWTEAFVGTGPFRVHETELGVPVLLRANDRYALGRPKVDEIELRVFSDANALTASMMAGAVDLSLGRGFDFDQAVVVERQWQDGRVASRFSGSQVIFAQFVGSNPPLVTDLRFRRALLQAIDRQQMVDQLLEGRGVVAHTFLGPEEPEFPGIEQSVVRHEYDPRRAQEAIEALGYNRGPDGILRDAANQRLSFELRGDPSEGSQRAMFAVVDFWQRLGVAVESLVIPQQRARDFEYIYTYPAFHLRSHSGRISSGLANYHSSEHPRPETQWVGSNRSRYTNPDLDAAIDRYLVTIPMQERTGELQTVMRTISEELPVLNLFYDPSFTLIANRVEGMEPSKASGAAGKTWNSHLWDLRS
ncbi:MAG: hypothetical protein GEU73_00080 [Chloroflexi bacterium]|nr:hypothetical protein [Chloroflexota bacterium]